MITITITVTITTTSAAKTDLAERTILLELYQATGCPSWNDNFGWDGGHEDLCEWYGVICVGQADFDNYRDRRQLDYFVINKDSEDLYRVMGLDLSANFLNGRIPSSLWKLPLLQYLNVNQNENLQVDLSNLHDAKQLSILKKNDRQYLCRA